MKAGDRQGMPEKASRSIVAVCAGVVMPRCRKLCSRWWWGR